jgi:O-antigen/teichoic acid export membrane protein
MLKLMSIGLLFRIVWQSLSYVILAKGDRKVYFIYDALVGNGFVFLANLGFYFLFGLDGLGYSFVISSVAVSIVLTFAVYKNYKVHFDSKFIKSFLFSLMICIVAYFLTFFNETLLSVGILFFSIVYAAIVISNRIGVDVFQFLKLKIEKYKC